MKRKGALIAVVAAGLIAVSAVAYAAVSSLLVLQTTTTWNGAPVRYLRTCQPEVKTLIVTIDPGSATAWHYHPVPNYAYMLQGELTVELKDGSNSHTFKSGEAFAEVVNTWHRGVNNGSVPVKVLVTYTGEVGRAVTVTTGDIPQENTAGDEDACHPLH